MYAASGDLNEYQCGWSLPATRQLFKSKMAYSNFAAVPILSYQGIHNPGS